MSIALAILTACNGNKFHVDGTVENASDTTTLVLEQSSNGEWYNMNGQKLNGRPTANGIYVVNGKKFIVK